MTSSAAEPSGWHSADELIRLLQSQEGQLQHLRSVVLPPASSDRALIATQSAELPSSTAFVKMMKAPTISSGVPYGVVELRVLFARNLTTLLKGPRPEAKREGVAAETISICLRQLVVGPPSDHSPRVKMEERESQFFRTVATMRRAAGDQLGVAEDVVAVGFRHGVVIQPPAEFFVFVLELVNDALHTVAWASVPSERLGVRIVELRQPPLEPFRVLSEPGLRVIPGSALVVDICRPYMEAKPLDALAVLPRCGLSPEEEIRWNGLSPAGVLSREPRSTHFSSRFAKHRVDDAVAIYAPVPPERRPSASQHRGADRWLQRWQDVAEKQLFTGASSPRRLSSLAPSMLQRAKESIAAKMAAEDERRRELEREMKLEAEKRAAMTERLAQYRNRIPSDGGNSTSSDVTGSSAQRRRSSLVPSLVEREAEKQRARQEAKERAAAQLEEERQKSLRKGSLVPAMVRRLEEQAEARLILEEREKETERKRKADDARRIREGALERRQSQSLPTDSDSLLVPVQMLQRDAQMKRDDERRQQEAKDRERPPPQEKSRDMRRDSSVVKEPKVTERRGSEISEGRESGEAEPVAIEVEEPSIRDVEQQPFAEDASPLPKPPSQRPSGLAPFSETSSLRPSSASSTASSIITPTAVPGPGRRASRKASVKFVGIDDLEMVESVSMCSEDNIDGSFEDDTGFVAEYPALRRASVIPGTKPARGFANAQQSSAPVADVQIDGISGLPLDTVVCRVLLYFAGLVDPATGETVGDSITSPNLLLKPPAAVLYPDFDSWGAEPEFTVPCDVQSFVGKTSLAVAVVEVACDDEGCFVYGFCILPIFALFKPGAYKTRLLPGDPRPSEPYFTNKRIPMLTKRPAAAEEYCPCSYLRWRKNTSLDDATAGYKEEVCTPPASEEERMILRDRMSHASRRPPSFFGIHSLKDAERQFARRMHPDIAAVRALKLRQYSPSHTVAVNVESIVQSPSGDSADVKFVACRVDVHLGGTDETVSFDVFDQDLAVSHGVPMFNDHPLTFSCGPADVRTTAVLRVYRVAVALGEGSAAVSIQPFGWTAVDLFTGDGDVNQGRFAAPLFAGEPDDGIHVPVLTEGPCREAVASMLKLGDASFMPNPAFLSFSISDDARTKDAMLRNAHFGFTRTLYSKSSDGREHLRAVQEKMRSDARRKSASGATLEAELSSIISPGDLRKAIEHCFDEIP
jgi:hypothetical protein